MLFDKSGDLMFESFEDVEVTPEETRCIGEAMIAAQLDDEELSELVESYTDVETAIEEDLLTEAAVKRYVVKLDRQKRMNQATKAAVFAIAREKKDPKMKKLMWVWKMERTLEEELLKKYKGEATRRARKTVDKAMKSRSNPVKKAAAKAKASFNKEVKPGKKK